MRRKKIAVILVVLAVMAVALWPVPRSYSEGVATHEQKAVAARAAELAGQVDWSAVKAVAIRDLQEYIRQPSVNPPGDTRAASEWLARRLQSAGIGAVVEETSPGRHNVIARLAGSGKLKPLLLWHHNDVVTVNPSEWKHHPFGGELNRVPHDQRRHL